MIYYPFGGREPQFTITADPAYDERRERGNVAVFIQELHRRLDESFSGTPLNDRTLRGMDELITYEFNDVRYVGASLMFADGAELTGGKAIRTADPNSVAIQWKAEFFPRRRHAGQQGDCLPLGFFREYDLYLGYQHPLPPTLIARYGDGPDDYGSYNPTLLGSISLAPSTATGASEVFAEALRRARSIGAHP